MASPFYGHSGLNNFDQSNLMRQIQNTAQDASNIKIGGIKENLQTNFNLANPVSDSLESQVYKQHVYQEVNAQLTSITKQLQAA